MPAGRITRANRRRPPGGGAGAYWASSGAYGAASSGAQGPHVSSALPSSPRHGPARAATFAPLRSPLQPARPVSAAPLAWEIWRFARSLSRLAVLSKPAPVHRIDALRCPAAATVPRAAPGQPCARCRTLATTCDRRLLALRRARAQRKQPTRSTWQTCPSILSSTRASSPHAVVQLAGNRTSHTCWMDCPRSFP